MIHHSERGAGYLGDEKYTHTARNAHTEKHTEQTNSFKQKTQQKQVKRNLHETSNAQTQNKDENTNNTKQTPTRHAMVTYRNQTTFV